MPHSLPDSALLCESCGYEIGGIPETGNCPECGVPIQESLPERRTGTSWQQSPGVFAWARTNWSLLRRPRRTFRLMRAANARASVLLLVNLVLTSFFIADPLAGLLIGDPARRSGPTNQWIAGLVSLPLQMAIVSAVLLALTWIECRGVRFFARKRGWRLTKAAAWQVCAHASVGWILSGLVPLLFLATLFILSTYFGIAPRGSGIFVNAGWFGQIGGDASTLVAGTGMIAGYGCGLLTFEMLVYVGVRQCRFANAPRAMHDGADAERQQRPDS